MKKKLSLAVFSLTLLTVAGSFAQTKVGEKLKKVEKLSKKLKKTKEKESKAEDKFTKKIVKTFYQYVKEDFKSSKIKEDTVHLFIAFITSFIKEDINKLSHCLNKLSLSKKAVKKLQDDCLLDKNQEMPAKVKVAINTFLWKKSALFKQEILKITAQVEKSIKLLAQG